MDTSPRPAADGHALAQARFRTQDKQTTGFASDFLNQFNEAVMLMDCVVSGDPSAIDELIEWKSRTYAAHFVMGRLTDRFETIRAYRLAPQTNRRRLDTLARELSTVVTAGASFLGACRRAGATASIVPMARHLAADARRRLAALEALVRPGHLRPSAADVSVLFAHRAA